ncbi:MAG: hypothetical protein CMJ78_08275 [Planctomycetaceae bacterium]|nr:hypothetical protein [Planctomycetaceae bacterium]
MTDLTLFVIGFGIFGLCIGGTLALSIGGSQQPARFETPPPDTLQAETLQPTATSTPENQ